MKIRVRLRSQNRNLLHNDVSNSTEENGQPAVDGAQAGPSRRRARDMRNYRSRMKEQPEVYQLHRQLETDRLQSFRRQMSNETKQKYNEKAKLRMRRMRAKKKAAVANSQVDSSSPRTRSAEDKKDKKREHWRKMKQAQRAKMSGQKKRRIRQIDKMRKRSTRATVPIAPMGERPEREEPVERSQDGFPSGNARRQAIYRARTRIPREASKYADVVVGLLNTPSPRKKAALKKKGVSPDPRHEEMVDCVKRTCKSLKAGRRRHFISEMTHQLDAKHGLKKLASRTLGIGYKYLMKYASMRRENKDVQKRQCRSDALDESTKTAINEHYEKPHVSTIMPNKKGIGVDTKAKRVLQRSLKETHKTFCQDNPDIPISKSKFAELRPKYVQVQSKSRLYQCLCETCTNIDLAMKALNLQVVQARCDCSFKNRYHLSDATLCTSEGIHGKLSCIDRQCSDCGVGLVDQYLQPLLDVRGDSEVTWQQWGTSTYGNGKKRIVLQRRHGKLADLVLQLKQQLESYPCHLFQARWQQEQFYSISKNPPVDTVVLIMDFAENYCCTMQHEVQSAHWYVAQVTLHPMIAYYRCTGTCGLTVREAIDIVSDDMQHDSHAVHNFVTTAVDHLVGARGLTPQRLIQFSDGCAAQYKSKTPFMDLSHSCQDMGIPQVERHYFGSSHGKNPCDGEGGIIKSAASRAVRSEPDVVISDAESFFKFASDRLTKGTVDDNGNCNHSHRTLFFIRKGEVDRDRPSRTDVGSLPGTRRLHSASCIEPGKLDVRRISCFCEACNSGDGHCANSVYIDGWTTKELKARRKQGDDDAPADVIADEDVAVADIPGGLAADDPVAGADGPDASHLADDVPLETGLDDGIDTMHPLNISDIEGLPSGLDTDVDISITDVFRMMMPDDPPMCPVNESTDDPNLAPSHAADGTTAVISTVTPREQTDVSGHPSTSADVGATPPDGIQIEEYYAVYYDRDFYIGRAIKKDGSKWQFKFMHRHRLSSTSDYDWPKRPDMEWIHERYIIPGPLKLIGNGPFHVLDLDRVEMMYQQMRRLFV